MKDSQYYVIITLHLIRGGEDFKQTNFTCVVLFLIYDVCVRLV